MIQVIAISAAAKHIAIIATYQSYESMCEAIGTTRFAIRILDGGDSLFFPEDEEDSTGSFEIDHCRFYAPAIIFRQGEYSIPEAPRMALSEAKRRVSHFTVGWDRYETNERVQS